MRAAFAFVLLALTFVISLVGCGGSGGGSSSGNLPTSITLVSTSDFVTRNGQAVFSVVKTGGDGGTAQWSIVEANGGTITQDGRYTAPNTDGVYTILVTIRENASIRATRTVQVGTGDYASSLTIAPENPVVAPSGTVTLTATKVGGSRGTVLWSVEGTNAGTITNEGVYTAPATEGTYKIRAALKENAAVFKVVSVIVRAPVTYGIEISSPTDERIMAPGSTLQFVAKATPEAAVTWSASEGTVNASGLYTAPSTPGTYTITATHSESATTTATRTVRVVANPKVRLSVEHHDGDAIHAGDIVLELDTVNTPRTAANMSSLVNKGFYDGILFHRYVPDFVIQGGDPLTKTLPLDDKQIGSGGPGYTIPFEPSPNKHLKYSLGMARAQDPDSAGSQFYICLEAQPGLDGEYVVFGRTVSGFDLVDKLRVGDRIVRAVMEP